MRNGLPGLRCFFLILLVAAWAAVSESASVRERPPQLGPPLQTVLEVENTARLLAILLDSGRYVINENQELFDDPMKEDKGFTPDVFEQQLVEMFRGRSGIDLRDLNSARVPPSTKKLLQVLVAASKEVVAEAQPAINRKGVGFKGFIPAVFGALRRDGYDGTISLETHYRRADGDALESTRESLEGLMNALRQVSQGRPAGSPAPGEAATRPYSSRPSRPGGAA